MAFIELWEDGVTLTKRVELPPGRDPATVEVATYYGHTYVRKGPGSCEYRRTEVLIVHYEPPPEEPKSKPSKRRSRR